MKCQLNGHQVGLTLGILFGLLNIGMALLFRAGFSQVTMMGGKAQGMMGVGTSVSLTGIIISFICGYIVGWLFTAIWNWLDKRK